MALEVGDVSAQADLNSKPWLTTRWACKGRAFKNVGLQGECLVAKVHDTVERVAKRFAASSLVASVLLAGLAWTISPSVAADLGG